MSKILVFGNSASGKSTLAKTLSATNKSAHLDLDTIAWQVGSPPSRIPLAESQVHINNFIDQHDHWLVEGCYGDLIELLMDRADELIFLNLPVALCVENAKARPWEPHKYATKQAQDENLSMLLDWIGQYPHRNDTFSQKAHQTLFDSFSGKKTMLIDNS